MNAGTGNVELVIGIWGLGDLGIWGFGAPDVCRLGSPAGELRRLVMRSQQVPKCAYITELQQLHDTFMMLVFAMQEYKSYMPSALLAELQSPHPNAEAPAPGEARPPGPVEAAVPWADIVPVASRRESLVTTLQPVPSRCDSLVTVQPVAAQTPLSAPEADLVVMSSSIRPPPLQMGAVATDGSSDGHSPQRPPLRRGNSRKSNNSSIHTGCSSFVTSKIRSQLSLSPCSMSPARLSPRATGARGALPRGVRSVRGFSACRRKRAVLEHRGFVLRFH